MLTNVTTCSVKSFGLHQSFTPKLRWFVKSFRGVESNPKIFSEPDAPSQLGVGKNMVTSMVHWALAFQIIRLKSLNRPLQRKAPAHYEPAPLGSFLLDKSSGVDPYLERAESLWLLHWVATRPTCRLPIWWLTFNALEASKFSSSDLELFCLNSLDSSEWRYNKPKMVKRDVDCLLRMYSERVSNQQSESAKDVVDELFRDLGLIQLDAATRSYQFVWGDKPSLTAPLIGLFAFDVLTADDTGQRTWSPTKLLNGPNGLAGRLKIGIDDLVSAWLELSSEVDIGITYPTGVPQFIINEEPERLRSRTLEIVFGRTSRGQATIDPFTGNKTDRIQLELQKTPDAGLSNASKKRRKPTTLQSKSPRVRAHRGFGQ